jgi:hypothetical protein
VVIRHFGFWFIFLGGVILWCWWFDCRKRLEVPWRVEVILIAQLTLTIRTLVRKGIIAHVHKHNLIEVWRLGDRVGRSAKLDYHVCMLDV